MLILLLYKHVNPFEASRIQQCKEFLPGVEVWLTPQLRVVLIFAYLFLEAKGGNKDHTVRPSTTPWDFPKQSRPLPAERLLELLSKGAYLYPSSLPRGAKAPRPSLRPARSQEEETQ